MARAPRRRAARQLHQAAWPDLFANLQTAYAELARAQFELQRRAADVEEAGGLLQRVVESLSEALFLLDPSGRVVRTNPAAGALLACDPAELVGRPFAELRGTDQLPATPWELLDRNASGVLPNVEVELRTGRGHAVPVSASCGLVRDTRGKIIGMLAVARDITERKRAEAAQRLLVEAGGLLSASLDAEATLQSVAGLVVPRLAEWCRVDLAEAGGRLRGVATAHADPARAELARELQRRYPPHPRGPDPSSQALRTGAPVLLAEVSASALAAVSGDAEQIRLRRELGFASVMAVPLKARGRLIGVMTFARGVAGGRFEAADLALAVELAHRAALAVDNARLYREAQEAIQLRDEFLSIAAHELKTPLTGLRASTQLTLRQLARGAAPDPARLRARLETIDQQTERLSRLVVRLLDISRLEGGQLRIERELTDVAALVDSTVRAARLATSRHTLVLAAPARLPARVDPLRFEQVVSNLLDNAIKYSPAGGRVEIEVAAPSPWTIRLAVRDRGIGIPPDRRQRIFDRYYQAHPGQHFAGKAGMGLGLYISRQIVELHGGGIEAEFPPDGGTRFVVSLPNGLRAPAEGGDGAASRGSN